MGEHSSDHAMLRQQSEPYLFSLGIMMYDACVARSPVNMLAHRSDSPHRLQEVVCRAAVQSKAVPLVTYGVLANVTAPYAVSQSMQLCCFS